MWQRSTENHLNICTTLRSQEALWIGSTVKTTIPFQFQFFQKKKEKRKKNEDELDFASRYLHSDVWCKSDILFASDDKGGGGHNVWEAASRGQLNKASL